MPWPALAYPLRVVNGQPVTIESGTIEHLETQGEVVLRTPRGTIDALPEMGLRDLIGTMGDLGPEILEPLSESIPEARFLAAEDASRLADGIRDLAVSIQREG